MLRELEQAVAYGQNPVAVGEGAGDEEAADGGVGFGESQVRFQMGLEERGLVALGAKGRVLRLLRVVVVGGRAFRVGRAGLVAFRRSEEQRPANLREAWKDAGELPVDDADDDGGVVGGDEDVAWVKVGVAKDGLSVPANRDGFCEDRHHLHDSLEDADVLLGSAVVRAPASVGGLVVADLADALVGEITAELGEGSPYRCSVELQPKQIAEEDGQGPEYFA